MNGLFNHWGPWLLLNIVTVIVWELQTAVMRFYLRVDYIKNQTFLQRQVLAGINCYFLESRPLFQFPA